MSVLRPCCFKPECVEQCPDLLVSATRPSHCECGHLVSLHKPTISPATIAAVTSDTPTPTTQISQSRWRDTIASSKGKSKLVLPAARKEVLAGFRTKHSDIPNAEPKPKGKRKLKDSCVEIRAIYFIDYAGEYLETKRNNTGITTHHIKDCPALDLLNKARLENSPLARVHVPNDPLSLDRNMDRQQTAEHLALLFQDLYTLACETSGWGDSDHVDSNWFIPLMKSYYTLTSLEGQSGATADQLIRRCSREARNNDTREIYLALPFHITQSMLENLGVSPRIYRALKRNVKGKGKSKGKEKAKAKSPSDLDAESDDEAEVSDPLELDQDPLDDQHKPATSQIKPQGRDEFLLLEDEESSDSGRPKKVQILSKTSKATLQKRIRPRVASDVPSSSRLRSSELVLRSASTPFPHHGSTKQTTPTSDDSFEDTANDMPEMSQARRSRQPSPALPPQSPSPGPSTRTTSPASPTGTALEDPDSDMEVLEAATSSFVLDDTESPFDLTHSSPIARHSTPESPPWAERPKRSTRRQLASNSSASNLDASTPSLSVWPNLRCVLPPAF
ncbi:hypothetical protein BDV93DRAFT_519758 [Ceratobasidium sp. AG-I]|nr:hypothetical protein BDV93DRAFT_519758 [Ceratobasidium sp. AG-I]